MTLQELHLEFKLGLDHLATASLPSFEPEEIDYLLNKAIDRFIKQRYNPRSNKEGVGFEGNEKRLDDLKNVMLTNSLTLSQPDTKLYQAILPEDYWFRVRLTASVNDIKCGISIAKGKVSIVSHDDLSDLLKDPFNIPDEAEEGPLAVIEGNNILLYASEDYTITFVYLTYIKKPIVLDITNSPSITCELADHTHKEIVDIAVSIALENIEAKRYQTNLNELSKTE